MLVRNSIAKKVSGQTASLLTGFLAVAAAALFVLSFSNMAYSGGNPLKGERSSLTLKGEIVAVDSGHHIRTLTLISNGIGRYPNDELNIFVKPDVKVKVCGLREPAGDIMVSRNAVIRYHELSGLAVADAVSERCS